jgi:hypothetical protein
VVVPPLYALIAALLGTKGQTAVDYLSDKYGLEGHVDYVGKLQAGNDFTTAFLTAFHGSYALVILNTCPLSNMDYQVIHALLKKRGLMAFTVYPETYDRGTMRGFPQLSLFEPPEDLFTLVNKGDTVVYQKI